MGRWLKILDDMSESKATKLTHPPSVGFVSTHSKVFHKKMDQKIDLLGFVEGCLNGFSVNAQHVIDHLLSGEDEQDIINGETPADSLRLYIKLWIDNGMLHYSEKKLG